MSWSERLIERQKGRKGENVRARESVRRTNRWRERDRRMERLS